MSTTIGILTAGGDCPGLNAVIRAVAKPLIAAGVRVLGVEDGFLGLIQDRVREIGHRESSGILSLGGTILGSSNKSNPRRFCTGRNPDGSPVIEDVTVRTFEHIARRRLEALVVIGGDGSMSCATELRESGLARGIDLKLVGVPKTIDNDIWGSEITFGFMTAVATIAEAVDKLRTTAASHHRVMVVEVMGRNAGWLALHGGVAGAADVILLPEIPWTYESVVAKILHRRSHGSKHSIVVVAEGARPAGAAVIAKIDPTMPDPIRLGGVGKVVSDEIERRLEAEGIESRHVVLGHMQRGGSPIPQDRILATQFGFAAAQLVLRKQWRELVVMQQGRITTVPLASVANKQRLVSADDPTIAAARGVGTSFGD